MEVVKPATYRRWLCQTRSGRPFNSVKRLRLTAELRAAVIHMAKENLLWGTKHIAGELKKLGFMREPIRSSAS